MLRNHLRSLRRAPAFTVTSILTLALGIALVTAAFSLVDGVLIRPLPWRDAGRLVTLTQTNAQQQPGGVSYPNFLDWQRQATGGAFSAMAYARGRGTTWSRGATVQTAVAAFVSPGFWGVMQPRPLLGRLFSPDEEIHGTHVVVLSNELWRNEFASDPGVIGRTLNLTADGSFTVIGVLPQDATFPEWGQIFLPIATVAATETVLSARDFHADSRTVARLAPGSTVARASRELDALAHRLATVYPADDRQWPGASVTSLKQELLGAAATQLVVLAAAMAMVLLIGWVNVTNLALVRATSQMRDLAIRMSLGASRLRLASQVAVEQGIITTVSAVVGGFAATAVLGLVRGFAAGAPGADTVAVNLRAWLFAVALAAVSTLVIAFLPMWRIRHAELTGSLKEGSGGAGRGAQPQRIRAALVAGEMAVALSLVISAGLLVKSFWRLSNVNPGFDATRLVGIDVSPPGKRYTDPAQTGMYYQRILAAVQGIPGVDAAALTNHMPLNGAALPTTVEIPGRPVDPAHQPSVLFRTLSPEYIGTLRIPLLRGRNFTSADLTSGTAVMVNRAFVQAFWPGGDAIGKQVMLRKSAQGFADLGEPLPGLIVGVIADVHHYTLASSPVPEIYIPYLRNPWSHMVVVARAHGDAAALIPGLRRAILGVDPATVLTGGVFGGFRVLADLRANDLSGSRFQMLLLAAFAGCGLFLSAVGIYGLMAYTVAQRTREIGIRMALGARAVDVLRLVVGSGARVIAAGVVGGLLGAVMLTRLAASMLYGVSATDPATFAVTAILLATVALGACYIPARRASRVDPVVVLRQ
jgi:putative ABC transport system permease protein